MEKQNNIIHKDMMKIQRILSGLKSKINEATIETANIKLVKIPVNKVLGFIENSEATIEPTKAANNAIYTNFSIYPSIFCKVSKLIEFFLLYNKINNPKPTATSLAAIAIIKNAIKRT